MKKLNKIALIIGAAGFSLSAMAGEVIVDFGGAEPPVTYSFSSMTVDSDVVDPETGLPLTGITINNAQYQGGTVPGVVLDENDQGALSCGEGTVLAGNECVSSGPQLACGEYTSIVDGFCVGTAPVTCGEGTSLEGSVCKADAPDLTPPSLNITSSANTLADGVTTATLTFEFGRAVQGFAAGDINVSAGSISNFTNVNESRWQATYNRSGNTAGTVTISVSSAAYLGTNGVAGNSDSLTLTLQGEQVNNGDVDLSACGGTWTTGVQRGPILDITKGFNNEQTEIGAGIYSMPFKTTNDSSYYAQFTITAAMGGTGTSRQGWISKCPGRNPSYGSAHYSCKASNTENFAINWAQGPKRGKCVLETGKQYFFNVECPNADSCRFYRALYR